MAVCGNTEVDDYTSKRSGLRSVIEGKTVTVNLDVVVMLWNFCFQLSSSKHHLIDPREGNLTYVGSQEYHYSVHDVA